MSTNNAINVPSNTIALINGAGLNTNITSMTGLTGALQAPTYIQSSTGLACIQFGYTALAVNYLTINNNVTGSGPTIDSNGSDSAVPLQLRMKNANLHLLDTTATIAPAIRFYNAAGNQYTALKVATAAATTVTFTLPSADGSANFVMKTNGSAVLSLTNGSQIAGTATNDNATSGNIGEFLSSVIGSGSPTGLSNNTAKDITSISLTTGDWDVWGNWCMEASGTAVTNAFGWVSTTSATLPDRSLVSGESSGTGTLQNFYYAAPQLRFSVSGTTNAYLSGYASFGAGSVNAYGAIYARRRR